PKQLGGERRKEKRARKFPWYFPFALSPFALFAPRFPPFRLFAFLLSAIAKPGLRGVYVTRERLNCGYRRTATAYHRRSRSRKLGARWHDHCRGRACTDGALAATHPAWGERPHGH